MTHQDTTALAAGASGRGHDVHTLTLTEAGEVFITEHRGLDALTTNSWCYEAKVAVNAFATRLSDDLLNIPADFRPRPGIYAFAIADDNNLHIGSFIRPL